MSEGATDGLPMWIPEFEWTTKAPSGKKSNHLFTSDLRAPSNAPPLSGLEVRAPSAGPGAIRVIILEPGDHFISAITRFASTASFSSKFNARAR